MCLHLDCACCLCMFIMGVSDAHKGGLNKCSVRERCMNQGENLGSIRLGSCLWKRTLCFLHSSGCVMSSQGAAFSPTPCTAQWGLRCYSRLYGMSVIRCVHDLPRRMGGPPRPRFCPLSERTDLCSETVVTLQD